MLLNNQEITEEIKEEIKKDLETKKEKPCVIYQGLEQIFMANHCSEKALGYETKRPVLIEILLSCFIQSNLTF